jgi:phosphoribosylaminoimidazole-succinocarboxamide synthase
MISADLIRTHLDQTLEGTDFPQLGEVYKGKVRDCYIRDGRRTLVATDRISAFDVVLGTIPFKGQVLNQMAAYWFRETAEIAPNHVVALPDPQVTVARECRPLKCELIMRGYLTGVTTTSIWHHYERGAREFCGHRLPEGMKKNQPLPEPLLTPSTKAEHGGHDKSVSRAELIAEGFVDPGEFDQAAALCRALFSFGQARAAARGLILVDTKYEVGVDDAGQIRIIDEIHTPDSSRYWYASDYEERLARAEEPRALDKEYVRRWLANEKGYKGDGPPPVLIDEVRIEAARRYIEAYELISGTSFEPDLENPQQRIRRNLRLEA